jgi:hypothetical protein
MKRQAAILFFASLLSVAAASAESVPMQSQKLAGYLTIAAILVSLPAFITLYLNIRKTNLGHLLFQPFLAIFIGFFGIMLNSVIDIWRVFQGYTVDNMTMVIGINRAISSVFIAVGCVLMFFAIKSHGLLSYEYYHKRTKETANVERQTAEEKPVEEEKRGRRRRGR